MDLPVLLVDDEADFVRTLAERLELRDLAAVTALDGESALAELAERDFEAVVLDVNLPGRSGLDVLREIKERWPLTEVVLLTGQADLGTAVAGMKRGAMDFLTKPVDVDALVRVLRLAVSRKAAHLDGQRMILAGRLAALGTLAEGVAHEINNPVNIIMQAAGWIGDQLDEPGLAGTPAGEEVRQSVEVILTQGRRTKEVIAKLYTLVGKVDPRKTPVDLADMARSALERAAARAGALGVEVRADLPPLPELLIAPSEMEIVLDSLIKNALDAMEGRGGTLDVAAEHSGEEVVLTIRDQGAGISREDLPRVFEPFFSTKKLLRDRGMGLGLTVSHSIVAGTGGRIDIASEPGQGAVVTVRLPLSPVRAEA